MSRDSKVYLEDILEAIRKIREFTSGMSLTALSKDAKTLDAVIRNLEVIGEAVKRLPEPIRSQRSDVEWKKIAGLRDILIHEYFVMNRRGVAQLGRALGSGPRGREFKSLRPDHRVAGGCVADAAPCVFVNRG